jgi:hypothetical protein
MMARTPASLVKSPSCSWGMRMTNLKVGSNWLLSTAAFLCSNFSTTFSTMALAIKFWATSWLPTEEMKNCCSM